MSCLLLVTRDPRTKALAEGGLETAGHEVIVSNSSASAIRNLFNVRVDTVVIDSSIGEGEVRELCDWRRAGNGSYPAVFLTSTRTPWVANLTSLNTSRDEVITEPFAAEDISRAVERTLAAADGSSPVLLSVGSLSLDKNSHELRGDETVVQLTPTEFRLMQYLAQRRGSVVSTDELLEKVWEFFPGTGSSELVRSHVRNLRNKLRAVVAEEEVVQTVPRRGYRLQ